MKAAWTLNCMNLPVECKKKNQLMQASIHISQLGLQRLLCSNYHIMTSLIAQWQMQFQFTGTSHNIVLIWPLWSKWFSVIGALKGNGSVWAMSSYRSLNCTPREKICHHHTEKPLALVAVRRQREPPHHRAAPNLWSLYNWNDLQSFSFISLL